MKKITTVKSGNIAEQTAADYLESAGLSVIQLNWKRTDCEIDIVAMDPDERLAFVEVKYRRNSLQGDGLDYITKTKLRQMSYAADRYISENKLNTQYYLAAISLVGSDYSVEYFTDELW